MNSRRMDAFYFLGLIAVVAVAWLATAWQGADSRSSEEDGVLPALEMPDVALEVPFEFPYRFVRIARPDGPKLAIAEDTETVIKRVRKVLIDSSTRVEVAEGARVATRGKARDRGARAARLAAVLD